MADRAGGMKAFGPRGSQLAAAVFAFILLFAASAAGTASFEARVIAITDGDTLTVEQAGARRQIRLVEIDAPELGQPWGQEAKNALSVLVLSKTVQVRPTGTDRYRKNACPAVRWRRRYQR